MAYTVKELSDLAGISVRTLHHYDDIALLRPASYTDAGYRLYGQRELARLQQILFFKELDFPLESIKQILNSPGFSEAQALRQHRELLTKRRERLDRLLQTVETTLHTIKGGKEMEDKGWFENFDMAEIEAHKAKYADEVNVKYKGWETKDKTKHYGKKEWAEVTRTGGQIQENLAQLLDEGKAPEDADVQAVIDRHFHYIDSSFYDCTLEIYAGLSELYVADPRFTKNIDKVRTGLADFQSKAMKVYCEKRKNAQ